jgi:antitoxin component of RelBE/YafQ-DinJ toxin-antitoxin module
MEKDMMESNQKVGNLTIRIDKDLLEDFKQICEKNGYDMSKRLRIYIQKEIEVEKKGKNLPQVIEKGLQD